MYSTEDREAYINSLSPRQIADSLTLQDVERFLRSLGIEDLEICKSYIKCPTYCHNRLDEEASMKLYWYQDHRIFHCYTECNENMTIFDFYRRFMMLNYEEVSFEDALYYVRQFLTEVTPTTEFKKADILIPKNKFQNKNQLVQQKEYNKNILDCFLAATPVVWQKEGISKEAMQKFDIRFSIAKEAIILPCYDIDNRLIGVRCRETNEERIKNFGKYHPIIMGETTYSFPSSQTLYGINNSCKAIQKYKKAIIVEGEKSVMKGYDFFKEDNIVVASLGSNNFGFYQLNLLTKKLGVTEIVLAFDKEFDNIKTPDAEKWEKKLIEICQSYKNFANFSYILDSHNYLARKDSPMDKGKEVFNLLYKERKKVR